jgi:hypothetical protein
VDPPQDDTPIENNSTVTAEMARQFLMFVLISRR